MKQKCALIERDKACNASVRLMNWWEQLPHSSQCGLTDVNTSPLGPVNLTCGDLTPDPAEWRNLAPFALCLGSVCGGKPCQHLMRQTQIYMRCHLAAKKVPGRLQDILWTSTCSTCVQYLENLEIFLKIYFWVFCGFTSPGYSCESPGGPISKSNHRCLCPWRRHTHITRFSPSLYAQIYWTPFSSDILHFFSSEDMHQWFDSPWNCRASSKYERNSCRISPKPPLSGAEMQTNLQWGDTHINPLTWKDLTVVLIDSLQLESICHEEQEYNKTDAFKQLRLLNRFCKSLFIKGVEIVV